MSRPIVAIVGRPNVGKSTLFNRILGWRKAIVDPQSGLTRDRLYGVAHWSGREFTIVDTAGLSLRGPSGEDAEESESREAVEAQTKVAIEEAEVIVVLVDVREGLTAIARDHARPRRHRGRLRWRTGGPHRHGRHSPQVDRSRSPRALQPPARNSRDGAG